MQDLDNKLKEILYEHNTEGISTLEAIAEIHKAFVESGYIHSDVISAAAKSMNLMNGKVWFERFEIELTAENPKRATTKDVFSDFESGYSEETVLEAARKASGLES